MFEFDDVFNKDPKSQFELPQLYVDSLNKDLPQGVKYIIDKNGNCKITFKGETITIKGIRAVPTESQKKILGKNFTIKDVLEYAYNAQQRIPVELTEEGVVVINDYKISIDKLEYNPLNPIKYIKGESFIIPPKFTEERNISIGNEKYERILTVHRVPNDSIDIESYSSKKDVISFEYNFNKKSYQMEINVSLDLKYAQSVKDIVEAVYIYNSFIDGKGVIQGEKITTTLKSENTSKYDEKTAMFWKKVLDIESKLKLKFSLPDYIDEKNVLEVEEIYQSLINQQPYRDRNIINTIKINMENKTDKEIDDLIGQVLFFKFNATREFELFDCKISLPAVLMIFNSKVLNVERDKTIILCDEDDENKRYTSIMCFENNEEKMKFLNAISETDLIQLFKDAKRAYEF